MALSLAALGGSKAMTWLLGIYLAKLMGEAGGRGYLGMKQFGVQEEATRSQTAMQKKMYAADQTRNKELLQQILAMSQQKKQETRGTQALTMQLGMMQGQQSLMANYMQALAGMVGGGGSAPSIPPSSILGMLRR